MSWSWKLGRIAGIPLYVHWTFLILLAYIGYTHYSASGGDPWETLEGVLMLLAVFGCVVLHELGHALMARRFGVGTADITLLPIGGVARLQRIPENPGQELAIALAGPAVNVALVVLLGGILAATGQFGTELLDPRGLLFRGDVPFLQNLLAINVILAIFNMIPAFPMDGGRVLRALLAMSMSYPKATRTAASVGQFIAIGFGLFGLTNTLPMFLLVALFVWLGAEAEARQVEERASLRGVSVRDAMLTDYRSLAPTATLGEAAELLLAGSQQDFPVIEGEGEPVGVLTRDALFAGLARDGREGRVGEHARAGLKGVEADSPLVPALARLREGDGPCLQVVEAGRPVGLLTLENIGELLMVRSALEATQERQGAVSRAPARPGNA
jgi:Zn-dependent protease